MGAPHARHGLSEEIGGNVDGHVALRPQTGQQALGLGAVARAEVYQGANRPGVAGDGLEVGGEDFRFAACGVILGQLRDRGEQAGAERVVQVFGVDAGGMRLQAGQQGVQGRVDAGGLGHERRGGGKHRWRVGHDGVPSRWDGRDLL